MTMEQRPPLLSITLLSAGILSFEILLMRLFSIIQWHHFAYMIISLALLGYGMSGAFVLMVQQRLIQRFSFIYTILILLFGLSSLVAFLVAQTIPFNAEEIFWNTTQIFYLSSLFLVLVVPFFFAASAICLTLRCYGDHVSRIYGYDLVGAGLGSMAVIALLYICLPQTALVCNSLTILVAAIVASWELKIKHRGIMTVVIILFAMVIGSAIPHIKLKLSPYKGLVQSLRINGTRIIEEHSSPLGLVSVVESTKIPIRYAPGLSLNSLQEPLGQLAVFTDGDNMAVITKKADNRDQLAYLDQVSSALPYHLKRPEKVLVLGVGGGTDILQAQYHKVSYIDGVELNSQIAKLLRSRYIDYAGKIFNNTTDIYINDIRGFVKKTKGQYNLIQLALTDAFSGSASGLYALNESHLYTVEALQDYMSRLLPNGYLALTRWIKMPPRDTLKLFATAVESLRGLGVKRPAERLVLIRSWQTSTLLIKRGDFTAEEIRSVQDFCDTRSFDIAFHPQISKSQINRYNILSQPYFYQAARSLTGEQAKAFIDSYKFNIMPATDDKPYFHHFFKWSSLPEIFRLRQQGSAPLLESGYLVLVAALIAAVIISFIVILLPLWLLQKESIGRSSSVKKGHVFAYFFLIGIAFLFIEIAFLQKFVLFLHHPILSISTGLTAFLVFAGIGSQCAQKISDKLTLKRTIFLVISGMTMFCVLYTLILDHLFALFGDKPLVVRIVISVVLISPLATLMGMPFPLALKNLVVRAEQLVPWAWGINGCASVISAALATLLAIHFGFTQLILMAVLFYFIAFRVLAAGKWGAAK